MKDYTNLSKDLVQNVGGLSNIKSLTHCMTRLRFYLFDDTKANDKAIEELEGIIRVVRSAGQYQIVVGNHVSDVYRTMISQTDIKPAGDSNAADEPKKSIGEALTDTISGIFAPILGTLSGAGMMKGFLAIAVFFGLLENTGGTYDILYSIGDGFFYFLPIILGLTAAEKFKGNRYIGIAIGCALCYPTLVALSSGDVLGVAFENTIFATNYYTTFLGIPVLFPASGYPSSVVPIIFACYFAAKVEKQFIKILPDVLKTFFVPLFTLAITVPLVYLVIGPLSTILCSIIGLAFSFLFDVSGVFAGALLGGVFQIFVIFGLHWGLVPLGLTNLGTYGYDFIIPAALSTTFAQGATVLAVYLKTKDKKLKNIALPAFISCMLGISEPAIYGVSLPKKKPFIYSCIGAAVGGAIVGLLGVKRFAMGGLGWFALATYVDPASESLYDLIWITVSILVAMGVSFAITMIFYKDTVSDEADDKVIEATITGSDQSISVGQIDFFSPLKGDLVKLDSISDEVFASGAIGDGVAIIPKEGKLYAPISGKVSALLPSGHAIGLTTKNGAELLIHVGMNTVTLEGKYFHPKVSIGDEVKKGDLLLEFDLEKLLSEGYDMTTPVVVTNSKEYIDFIPNYNANLKNQDLIFTLI